MNRLIPRREPRILALSLAGSTLAWVCADLYELRSSGEQRLRGRSTRPALRQLVARERPSAIAAESKALRVALARITGRELPLVDPPTRLIPFSVLADLYPEASLFAPTPRLERLARQAVTVSTRELPSRHYATSRQPSVIHPTRSP
jgi:hypothetical protein